MADLKVSENGKVNKRGLSYYHNPGSGPLKMVTLGQLLEETTESTPDKDAIISFYEKKKLTFRQVKNEADMLAAGCLKLGLKPGDRVALIGVNSVQWYVSMMAAAKVGLIIVMLNPAYRTQELRLAIKKSTPRAIMTDRSFKTQDYIEMLYEIVPGMSSVPHGQPLKATKEHTLNYVMVATEEKLPGCYRIQDVCKLTNDFTVLRNVENSLQPDDPLCIQLSSGTTGEPKLALISHLSVVNASCNFGRRLDPHNTCSIYCVQVPFFHIFGICGGIVFGMCPGRTLLTPSPIFSKDLTIQALQNYKLDLIYGTPTMFLDLYIEVKKLLPDNPKLRDGCNSVEIIGCGGSLIFPDLISKMAEVFPKSFFIGALGMTEAGCCIFTMLREDSKETKATTIGCLSDYLEVKIVDDEGKMVPFGTQGEAWYRSIFNLLEYWGEEEKTKEAKDKAGWFKSGDIISLREDGYATIKGRRKEMIIRGGENIFPAEIETFFQEHPDIVKAEVYGVDDERLGEAVAASIKLKSSSTLDEASLRSYCNGKISHFKIPKYIRFVEQFPMTSSGKVQKFKLKEMLEKELNGQK